MWFFVVDSTLHIHVSEAEREKIAHFVMMSMMIHLIKIEFPSYYKKIKYTHC